MSESQNEDARRRERARRVDALTDAARQPGEGPRLGTRIAGSVAVVALVAGATLGIGAWHSYQTEQDAKKQKAAAARKKQEAAARKSADTRHRKTSDSPSGNAHRTSSPQKSTERPHRSTTQHKKRTASAGVAFRNADTSMCADLPGFTGHPEGGPVNEAGCHFGADDNQMWKMKEPDPKQRPGGHRLVVFANAKDGNCLDLPDTGAKPPGTHVVESPCHTDAQNNQLWWLEKLPGGDFRVHNVASDSHCLEVDGDRVRKPDTPLVIGDCNASTDDSWQLRK